MKRTKLAALLALPFVLGALLWPMVQHRREQVRLRQVQLRVQRATQALMAELSYESFAHPDKVEALLNEGARLDARDNRAVGSDSSGYTPLHLAVSYQFSDVVRLILNRKVDLEAHGTDGRTPLICACALERQEITTVQILLDRGANLEARDKEGSTPLMWAVTQQNERSVALLLKRGAKANAKDYTGLTALQMANMEGTPSDSAERLATSRRIKRMLQAAGAKP